MARWKGVQSLRESGVTFSPSMSALLAAAAAAALLVVLKVRKSRVEEIRIAELLIYPIKSCGGTSVSQAVVTTTGFRDDRRWMLVTANDGKMVTLRKNPSLVLVKPLLIPGGVIVTAPGMPDLTLPILPRAPDASNVIEITIWGTKCPGVDQGSAASAWFTSYLNRSAPQGDAPTYRLVYQDDPASRPISARWGYADPPSSRSSGVVSYADGHPFLIATQESIQDLNYRITARGGTPVEIYNFRPNIITSGSFRPWAEDNWGELTVGSDGLKLYGYSRCQRCVATTVNRNTGQKAGLDAEPLDTMRTFRKGKRSGCEVIFGTNMVPSSSLGGTSIMRVGDAVNVDKLATFDE